MLQGLINVGNTCYMNSVLQMLYKLEDLMLEIDSIYSNSKEHSFYLTYYFMEIFYDINKRASRPDTLREFRNVICTNYPQFQRYQPQDAQEFLLALLDMLHKELKKPDCPAFPQLEYTDESQLAMMQSQLLKFLDNEGSPIAKYFGTIVQIMCKCSKCEKTSYHLELQLSIQISTKLKCNTVQGMLQKAFQPEEVNLNCSKCGQSRKFQKCLRITQLPKYLILGIDRFEESGLMSKFMTFWSPQTEIEIANNFKIGPKRFDLLGLIDHQGDKTGGGHYRYYHQSGKDLICMDDYKISLLPESVIQQIMKHNISSYILIYSNK